VNAVYAVSIVGGSMALFKEFISALNYWEYVRLGDGINPSLCDLLGISRDEVTLCEIAVLDAANWDVISHAMDVNKARRERQKHGELLELRQAADKVHPRADQEPGCQ